MLFRQSPLHFNPGLSAPSVLALLSDSFLGEIRVRPFLNALLGRGIIADYRLAHRKMSLVGPDRPFAFTHIWCHRNISTAQFRFLKRHAHAPIIYEVDDLITSAPEFVIHMRRRTRRRTRWCFDHARAVVVSTERLAANLSEDAPQVAGKLVLLRNGCNTAPAPFACAPRRELVWTSGDLPFFLNGQPEFLPRLARLANKADFEVVLIGRFSDEIVAAFARCRRISHLDFVSYREFLGTCAGAIGLAPLPTGLPPDQQRFFDSKSDIKLIDFLSSGLVPVFSRAVPYVTSSLFLPELAGSTGAELLHRLETCFADPARMIEYVNKTIHAPGRLKEREFGRLSMALDRLFQ